MKEAIVLAGGMGTRLQSVVCNVPKPMADINGRPFLEYLLTYLYRQEVKRVILSVGYLSETIISYFGPSYRGMTIEYSIEEEPLGTGGAVKAALPLVNGKDVLIVNGDTYFPVELEQLYAYHRQMSSSYSLSLKYVKDASRYGVVIVAADGRISSMVEKQVGASGFINGGISLLKTSLLSSIELPKKFSLERELLEKLYNKYPFYGKVFDAFFIDIGIPEDYFHFARVAADLVTV